MEKDFVPYEEALALKELGFDEKCFCNWEESWSPEPEHEIRMVLTTDQTWLRPGWISAPTFSQAFRWFRDNFGLYWPIMSKATPSNNLVYYIYHGRLREDWNGCFESYEEAELACLKNLIEISKNK